MRFLSRSIVLGLLATLLASASAHAQGSDKYSFYIGGEGGLMSVKGTGSTRDWLTSAGGHILVTGNRTGLLIAVDQGFGKNKAGNYAFVDTDSTGAVTAAGTRTATYTGVRRYTFAVLLFPVQHSVLQPYLGIGAGIMHTTGTTPGGTTDPSAAAKLGTEGFLTGIGGLEFRIAGLSAFGQVQISSAPATRYVKTTYTDKSAETVSGTLFTEPTYSAMAGLRFSLGSARSSGGPSSY